MAVKRTTIDKIAEVIGDVLEDYVTEITEDVNEAALTAGKQGRSELRQTSPKRTGQYARGWDTLTTQDPINKALTVTVYNAKMPQLTHLLENGHAKRGGGRVNGIPHIRPAEQNAVNEFVRLVKEAIERGKT